MSMTTMEYYDKNVESNGTYVPVERYVDEYCKALTENYKQDSMRSHERSIMKGDNPEYHGERLLEILNDKANLDKFRYIVGKKYFKVLEKLLIHLKPVMSGETQLFMRLLTE